MPPPFDASDPEMAGSGGPGRQSLPYDIIRPARQTVPFVFASPHSGRDYPADFVRAARLDPTTLRSSEDAFVDDLFAGVPGLGAVLLLARFPRAFVDVNREPLELDPDMFEDALPSQANTRSARVSAGLGTIARIVANGEEIYAGKLRYAEAARRIERFYRPYHQALSELLDETRRAFGFAVLIDCHSMPSVGGPLDTDPGLHRVDMILGDCHGVACAPALSEMAGTLLQRQGFAVRYNNPYAGGFTTRHYGRPAEHCHALQIELNRALYMDETVIAPNRDFARIADAMTQFAARLVHTAPARLAA